MSPQVWLTPNRRFIMRTGLHALGWGLPRLGLAVAVLVFVPVLLYALVVFVMVAGQAVAAFGQ